MNTLNKLFLNNIARSAAIVGLMLSPLTQSNADLGNDMFRGARTMGNIMGGVRNQTNNNVVQKFANSLNKSNSPLIPQALLKTSRAPINPMFTSPGIMKGYTIFGNKGMMNRPTPGGYTLFGNKGMMNRPTLEDIKTQNRINAIQYGEGKGMMTRKTPQQAVMESFTNWINQGKARSHTVKTDVKQRIQGMRESVNVLRKEIIAQGQHGKQYVKKEFAEIKNLAKDTKSNLKKAQQATTKSNYFAKKDFEDRSKDVKKLKTKFNNLVSKIADVSNSLNHLEFEQAKNQIRQVRLRAEGLASDFSNVVTKKSPNLSISNMHTKEAVKYTTAAGKNVVKILAKSSPAALAAILGGATIGTAGKFWNK